MGILDRVSDVYHGVGDKIGAAPGKVVNGGQQLLQNPRQFAEDHQDEGIAAGTYMYGGGALGTGVAVPQGALNADTAVNATKTYQAADAFDATPGAQHDMLFGGANAYKQNQATMEEDARNKAAQERENNLLSQNAANFGEGFSPNATQNASRMTAQRNSLSRGVEQGQRTQADDQYQAGLTGNRIRQASSGTSGSGADAQARSDLLSNYYGRLAGAATSGANAGTSYDTRMLGQKNRIAGAIKGGEITDTTGMGFDASSLGNTDAYANAVGNSIGSVGKGKANNLLSQAY